MLLIKTLRNFNCVEITSSLKRILMNLGYDNIISDIEVRHLDTDQSLCVVTFKRFGKRRKKESCGI